MSGPWHMTGRARVSARMPEAHGVCDFCGFRYLLKDLRPQQQWAGSKLQTYPYLVCRKCWDVPQPQLKSIVIPADPLPVYNPRPEQYDYVEPNFVATESATFAGSDLTTEGGDNIIWEDETTPLPDPNNPALYPP